MILLEIWENLIKNPLILKILIQNYEKKSQKNPKKKIKKLFLNKKIPKNYKRVKTALTHTPKVKTVNIYIR